MSDVSEAEQSYSPIVMEKKNAEEAESPTRAPVKGRVFMVAVDGTPDSEAVRSFVVDTLKPCPG